MAKVRVYELAKELGLESKKLVEKLTAGGMDVKNYMSTLDEQSVVRAREIVSGAVSEVVMEKRIKPTVIRRRKKVVRVEQKPPETAVAEEKAPETKTAPKEDVLEKKREIKEIPAVEETPKGEPEEKTGVSAPAEVPLAEAKEARPEPPDKKAERPVKRAKAKPKRGKKKKVEKPAKIIMRPEEGPLKDLLAKKAEVKKEATLAKTKTSIPKPPLEPPKEKGEKLKKGVPLKKKGRKGAKVEDVPARGLFRRRKKEVYERADLYNGRPRKRKGPKRGRKGKEPPRNFKHTEITLPKAIKRRIKVQDFVTVVDLAKAMGTKAAELMKRLINLGVMANINQPIDFESASVVADDLGFELELDTFEEESFLSDIVDRPEDLSPRPPVVTIMGHVDHGKTSLLDYIRQSNIIGGESGGITQHIGAYYVKTAGGDIVFLDTPGHEAFTAMRARGAKVTDIIVLVVAADDGAMPQTKEAINHARAANIPIVVAVNKIDKPEADPEKVKRELAELDLAPEEWGGDTLLGHVSAKTGEGVENLLGLILLQTEMLELQGNPNREARGTVIEAELDKSRGPVATVLIKNGSLNPGCQFVCGDYFGRVRAMLDHMGRMTKSAGPSVPVKLYGISGVPMAGDEFIVVKDEKTAKQIIEHRKAKSQKQELVKRGPVSLDDLFDRINKGDVKELNIILKTDVQGSAEALSDSLVKQSTEAVKLNVIHSATGAITESDVMLATASGAIIIGFNVRTTPRVVEVSEKENVDIRYYDVIYNAINDIRLAMTGLLEPVLEEHVIGHAEVKEIFRIPKVGAVAGCQVTDGHVDRNANVRLLRDNVVVFDGKLASLRRFKEDVKEVQTGYECGIGLENFGDIKPADIFEVYEVEEVAAEL
ncbi:MAG: translation initiation factor IF-2 [Desulfobacteraceae bacterium]|nr:translation initiation factor IF-2 [Desulfobacteraceae bacterium]